MHIKWAIADLKLLLSHCHECNYAHQMQPWRYCWPTVMKCNYGHHMNYSTPNKQMQHWCFCCPTAMECNYAPCGVTMHTKWTIAAIVVPLPWSTTMYSKWTIAGSMLLLSHCHWCWTIRTIKAIVASVLLFVALPCSVTMHTRWAIVDLM